MNERFAKLAEDEKGKNMRRDSRRRDQDAEHGPPQPVSARFAAAAEMDRTAPRGGDYRDREGRDRDRGRMDDAGPPPPTNSRWGGDHGGGRDRDRDIMDRGGRNDRDAGPPVPTYSRFAAVAMDHEAERGVREQERADRGPPPQVTNSRIAAATADHERESGMRDRERGDSRFGRRDDDDRGGDRFGRGDERGGGGFGRGDERGGGGFGRNEGPPPMVQAPDCMLIQ